MQKIKYNLPVIKHLEKEKLSLIVHLKSTQKAHIETYMAMISYSLEAAVTSKLITMEYTQMELLIGYYLR